jgi:hypothetical protein
MTNRIKIKPEDCTGRWYTPSFGFPEVLRCSGCGEYWMPNPDEGLGLNLLEILLNGEIVKCPVHGYTLLDHEGSGPGHAGARIWWAGFRCGCQYVDESGDVEAAR